MTGTFLAFCLSERIVAARNTGQLHTRGVKRSASIDAAGSNRAAGGRISVRGLRPGLAFTAPLPKPHSGQCDPYAKCHSMMGRHQERAVGWAALLLARNPLGRATASQIAVFFQCYSRMEPQSIRDIARQLGLARSRVSRAVSKLESWSLVTCAVDPTDARAVVAKQTEAGLALLARTPLVTSDRSIPGSIR